MGLALVLFHLCHGEIQAKILTKVANGLMVGLFVIFSINIPQGHWQLNPFWIILFSRVQGLAFTTVHTTSVYGVVAITAYLVIRDRKTIQPYKWILVVFGTAGIHEWMLYSAAYLIQGQMFFAYWQDAVWFLAFILLGFTVANSKQRKWMLLLAIPLMVFEFTYVGFFHDSDVQIEQYTVSAISDNLIEVLSWLVIPLGWALYED